MRTFCIAKELALKGMIQTFAMIFQTHPKTRQNPLREILLVLRQKYTWTSPSFFLDFPGLFPVFFRESEKTIFTIFPENFYEKMGRESGN